jgi:hypothetical protein
MLVISTLWMLRQVDGKKKKKNGGREKEKQKEKRGKMESEFIKEVGISQSRILSLGKIIMSCHLHVGPAEEPLDDICPM